MVFKKMRKMNKFEQENKSETGIVTRIDTSIDRIEKILLAPTDSHFRKFNKVGLTKNLFVGLTDIQISELSAHLIIYHDIPNWVVNELYRTKLELEPFSSFVSFDESIERIFGEDLLHKTLMQEIENFDLSTLSEDYAYGEFEPEEIPQSLQSHPIEKCLMEKINDMDDDIRNFGEFEPEEVPLSLQSCPVDKNMQSCPYIPKEDEVVKPLRSRCVLLLYWLFYCTFRMFDNHYDVPTNNIICIEHNCLCDICVKKLRKIH